MSGALLEVRDLHTEYRGFGGSRVIRAVDGVSFRLEPGKTLGLVGESGCGKTTTCLSLMRLLPPGAAITEGSIELDGVELTTLSAKAMQRVRGAAIAMILQDPMASLNPLFTIGDQVGEPARQHRHLRGGALAARVRELLAAVRIPSPDVRRKEHPHQMSGGMRQRIAGAIALSATPRVIIADEPTTSLDVTVQAQYLDLLKTLQADTGVAMVFVTHDLGIVAKMCDEVIVMYAGKPVEQGSVRAIFSRPRHPYADALLRSVPKMGSKEPLFHISGQPPDLAALPPGCDFAPRCPKVYDRCWGAAPPLLPVDDGHSAACWLVEDDR
ncbi:MAG: ATP-binding cassette domain-containing protein [Acidimicrobiia bacterium]|nr:ATP-binding cassette domain-containing protein [Acidimicrobiia bacterium]